MSMILKKINCFILALLVIAVSTPIVFAQENDVDVVDADSLVEYGDAVADLISLQEISGKDDSEKALENEYYSCRIIVKSKYVKFIGLEEFEPLAIVYNEDDTKAIVQFESEKKAKECLEILKLDEKVEYAEMDTMMKIESMPERKIFSATENMRRNIMSWGVSYSHADTFVNNLVEQGNNVYVIVSVVDTGVNLSHPYLSGRLLTNSGYDFANGDSNPEDDEGHGTHVSGTIVDVTGDLNVKILPVKVLDDKGGGYMSAISSGIKYAADLGAQVINLSLGCGHENNDMEDAIEYAMNKGTIVCVAAGNESTNAEYSCPAHYTPAICVSAISQYEILASFSNYGNCIDFSAPGVDIYSCYAYGQYAELSGTSMATPHVTAYVAILKTVYPGADQAFIEKKMREICIDLGSSGWDYKFGYGTVDFNKHGSVHEHVIGDWQWNNDPTCTEQGRNVRKCTECGYIMDTEYIPALGHNYSSRTVAPTCTEKGYDINECSRCHDSTKTNYVSALGHDMAEPEILIPVGCTKNGLVRTKCTRCSYRIDEEIVRTGHNYQTSVVERSCNTAGYTLHKCSNCGESYMTDYVAAFDHTPGNWEVQTVPTCISEGREVIKCTVCGDVVSSRSISTSGHDYVQTVIEPTCTSAGHTKYTCKNCSDTYTENETQKLGHDYQVTNVVKASSCTTQGLAYTKCSRCNAKSTAKLPLSEHTAGQWQTVTPATETSEGLKAQYCTVCGNLVNSQTIPMITYELTAKEGSATVVDESRGIIYGVEEGVENLESYITSNGGTIEYIPTQNGLGTGTTVNILNDKSEIVKSYKLVIFGDVDGDGYCDGCDYVLLSLYINWQYDFDECCLYAADITNDGYIDAFDLSLSSLSGVQLYKAQQTRQLNNV